MHHSTSRICLVTSRHVSYNPRLYKEACALSNAGFLVRVVGPNLDPRKSDLEEEQVNEESWTLDRINAQRHGKGHWRWLRDALRQRLLNRIPLLQRLPYGMERAYSRHVDALFHTAIAQPADLFVAHNLQALPAAAWAAEHQGSLLGFDAEDFHRGEFNYDNLATPKRSLTIEIEETYIPQCDHLTAASPGIADAYEEILDINRPTVILNVFPKQKRSGQTPSSELAKETPGEAFSIYWYSQTIGPDRGLEHVVCALPEVQTKSRPVFLSLRGRWNDGYEHSLRNLAREIGVGGHLRHLSPVPPEELIERAAQHDIGLALEQPVSRNREICVTNKLFAYLLAGLPVVATRTQGQKAVCANLSSATRLCTPDNSAQIAEAISSLLESNEKLRRAEKAAWAAGEERYNWEVEQNRLINAFEETISSAQLSSFSA
ncbi:glycosyltransferase [Salinibacter ruber]|uniref:glycosyltransferase n=1 Tax=Salinibacter ruber TaxID=146919 RepID=UPI000E588EFA|nr:glycosyltransferase [Salinibacter ruber]